MTEQPQLLETDEARSMARRIRDCHWSIMILASAHDPVWICWWNKNRHHPDTGLPADLVVLGLISGMEFLEWTKCHPDWWVIGEWDAARYAAPVRLTDAGRAALADRARYDMEPVTGGLVFPGWTAIPMEVKRP